MANKYTVSSKGEKFLSKISRASSPGGALRDSRTRRILNTIINSSEGRLTEEVIKRRFSITTKRGERFGSLWTAIKRNRYVLILN